MFLQLNDPQNKESYCSDYKKLLFTVQNHCSSSPSSNWTPLPTTPITANIGSGLQQQRQRLRQCRPQHRSQPSIASPRRVTAFNNPQRRSHRSSLSSVPALLTSSAINRTSATAPAATHHPQRPHLRQQPTPSSDTGSTAPPSSNTRHHHLLPSRRWPQARTRSEPSPTAAATGHRS